MVPDKVVVLQEHLPVSLSAGQTLWLFEVCEVFMVGENGNGVGDVSEVLVPFG